MSGSEIILFIVISAAILYYMRQSGNEKKPEAMINRTLDSGSEPSDSIKAFDRSKAIEWAREVIEASGRVAIIDTETTGIGEKDEIIQIGAIDANGKILLDTLIRPTSKIVWAQAESIHGISPEMVKNAPTFDEAWSDISEVLSKEVLVIYNAKFDGRLLSQSAKTAGVKFPENIASECAMIQNSLYQGKWDSYRGHYKWHKLRGGDHSAIGDCYATLKLILKMADDKSGLAALQRIIKKWKDSSRASQNKPAETHNDLSREGSSPAGRFSGKEIVFTGFSKEVEADFAYVAKSRGFSVWNNVRKKSTTHLCHSDEVPFSTKQAGREITTKHEAAIEWNKKGCDIKIMSESQFKKQFMSKI